GVISTSALEAGIDIGGLDVCILLGYPGTVTSTWQRAGRVGRGSRESLIVLVAGHDALDQYVVRHPDQLFSRGAEAAVCDPANPEVLRAHLPCAAQELPLRDGDPLLEAGRARGVVQDLQRAGELMEVADGGEWIASRKRPQRLVSIREVGKQVAILDPEEQPIGMLSSGRAVAEAHPGAIYLHRGRTWEIESLDLEHGIARASAVRVPFYTEPLSQKETEILEVLRVRPAGNTVLKLGRVKVTTTMTGYQRRHTGTREVMGQEPLELPPQVMVTEGMWVEIPPPVEPWINDAGGHFMGAIHAAEHATIAVVPLFVLCDRGDVAGISYRRHEQVRGPAIFFYDGYPGGVGLCARAFEVAEQLLQYSRNAIDACACEEGCPACVHSPRCGNGNQPMDKAGAVRVLDVLTGATELAEVAAGAPEPLPAPEPEPPAPAPPVDPASPRVVIFDLETQRSAAEVGGWDKAHLMRVAVGVACVLPENEFHVFREAEMDRLIALCDSADLVVGFNSLRFDYQVLSAYTPHDLQRRWTSLDLLRAVKDGFGRRIGLAKLGEVTLGVSKSADGLQSLRWWKEGRVDEIIRYCTDDVALTRDLYRHGLAHGHLLADTKGGERVRVPVDFATPTVRAGGG
ncbi:MAG: Zn-binding domain-containing protein, partial [Planctomycetota bacterium]